MDKIKNNIFIRFGLPISCTTAILVLFGLYLLRINNQSVLFMIIYAIFQCLKS